MDIYFNRSPWTTVHFSSPILRSHRVIDRHFYYLQHRLTRNKQIVKIYVVKELMEIFTVHVDHTILFTFMIESFFVSLPSFFSSFCCWCCSCNEFLVLAFSCMLQSIIIKSKAPGLEHLHLSSFTVRLFYRSQSQFSEDFSAESTIMKRDSIALNNMPKESNSFIYSFRTFFYLLLFLFIFLLLLHSSHS